MGSSGILNGQTLDTALISFQTLFNEGIAQSKPLAEPFVQEIDSNGRQEAFKWMGPPPAPVRSDDEPTIGKLRAFDWTITNEKYANGIEVDEDDLEDDKLGLITPRIRQLADTVALQTDEMAFSLLGYGFTDHCYDGLPFFSTAHPNGDGTTT